ncbi:MAG: imidazolonepropionase [Deltaproteobacteria bacterium]|nr:imidazolonepropionase [Deltaproteobacteria bacterium]
MELDVLHHGSAIRLDGRVIPLCALWPGARESHRLLKARKLPDKTFELRMSNGDSKLLPDTVFLSPPLLIENISQLLTCADEEGVGLLEDVSVFCRGGRVEEVIPAGSRLSHSQREGVQVLDGRGCVVTPGLVDPHTHPVFAGQRSVEFGLKAAGATYLEIHKAGGGIQSTVDATRAASFEALEAQCWRNLSRLLSWGVTTCEGKSGYALETEGELRLLEVLRSVSQRHPIDVIPTLLGAHSVPREYRERREDYLAQVIHEMIPRAASEGLARYCDVYCEEGAFTLEETERVFAAAQNAGLGLRLHAEQFTDQGGTALAAHMGAASVDHLEAITPDSIAALAKSQTHAVLLPGAALSCRAPWPPATALVDAGVPIALGTDFNPGSSMTASLPLMMSLACMQMGISVELAWRAVTVESARSLGLKDVGQIIAGYQADLVIFDAPDYRYIPYHYGENHVRTVIKGGQVVSC